LDDLNLPDVNIQQLTIPENSIINGKSIQEFISPLKYNINILVLRKREKTIQNPDQSEIINSGDNLVVFGKPMEIELMISEFSLIPNN